MKFFTGRAIVRPLLILMLCGNIVYTNKNISFTEFYSVYGFFAAGDMLVRLWRIPR